MLPDSTVVPAMTAKEPASSMFTLRMHARISRVGSGASAAAGASATPTYIHRKLIGIMILGLIVTTTNKWNESPGRAKTTMTVKWSNEAVNNVFTDNVANNPNPNHFGNDVDPNPIHVDNHPPSHTTPNPLSRQFHNPPLGNGNHPNPNPPESEMKARTGEELTWKEGEEIEHQPSYFLSLIIPYLAAMSSYYHGSNKTAEPIVNILSGTWLSSFF